MENNLPTAIEFAKSFKTNKDEETTGEYISSMLIEFAKLHVEAALKEASKQTSMKCKTGHSGEFHEHWSINKKSIINSYSLDNIK